MAYIGFRIELTSNLKKRDLEKIIDNYNSAFKDPKILEFKINSHVIAGQIENMIVNKNMDDKKNSGIINFSMMTSIKKSEAKRIAQIINVLGNDRLIKEKVQVFVQNQSMLNNLPEIFSLLAGIKEIDKHIHGVIKNGWFYAPEILL